MSPELLNPQRFCSNYRNNCGHDRRAPGMAIHEIGWPVHPLRWSRIYPSPSSDQPQAISPHGANFQKNLSTPRDFWDRCNRAGAGRIRIGQPPASCSNTFPELVILGVSNHLGRCLQHHRLRFIQFFANICYKFTREA